MDRQERVVGQFEDDHLEKVAGAIGTDHEHLRWIGVGFEIHDHDRMISGMCDVIVADAMAPRRPMDFHTPLV